MHIKYKNAQKSSYTGKSFSEALILASTNPQYDNRLFMELPGKLQAKNMFCACSFHGNYMNTLLSFCGLIDAKEEPLTKIYLYRQA